MLARKILAAVMIFVGATVAGSARADSPIVYNTHGNAIFGFDTVAYHTLGEARDGSAEFTHEWMDVTWRFISAEHRDLFAADPEKYAPAYGGWCAYAVSFEMKVATDPEAWKIVDGRLYLQQSPAVLRAWGQDVPYYVGLGDEAWPKIMHEAPDH